MRTILQLFKNSLLLLLPLLFGVSVVQGQSVIIGTGTTTSNGSTADPVERYYNYEHTQIVYLASELTAGGMSAGASITGLGFSISESASSLANFTINMGHTSQTLANPMVSTGLVIVRNAATYSPVVQTAGNFDMITFNTNFTWNGTSNIVIDICTGSNPFTSPYGGLRYTTATSGAMREYRLDGSSNCGTYSSGTNYAYRPNIKFNYTAGTACSGTPTGGTAQANSTSTTYGSCLGSAISFGITGGASASGLTYQWQYSNTGSSYSDISGATSATYSVASMTAGNVGYYQRITTCTASGQSGTSAAVQVTQNAFYNCYCVGNSGSCTGGDHVTNVTLGTINNSTGACVGSNSLPTYSDYKSTVAAPNLSMGGTYPLSVSVGNGGTEYASAWIDYNQNGIFEASEYISVPMTLATVWTGTVNITIPSTALSGNTALRVRSRYSTAITSADACTTFTYGETEDYLVNITCPVPTALTATAITSSGATLGWTSSSSNFDIEYGVNGFSLGTGTTSTSATNSLTITGLAASTSYDFFVRTNCGSGSYSTWAGPYTFTSGSATDGAVSAIVVTDLCSGMSDVTVLLSNVGLNPINAGDASLDLQVNGMSAGAPVSNSTNLDIIGSGNPTTETITFTNVNLNPAGSFIFTVTATITGDGNSANDVTNTTKTIGIVSAGTATTTASGAICPSVTFNLGLTGASGSTSTTYQWEKSTNGGGIWSNVSSATSATITNLTQNVTTIYHCVLTCGSTTVTSSDITVTTNPFYNCYCTAGLTSSGAAGDIVTNVTFGTLVQASGGASPYYTNYASTQNAIPNLSQGSSSNILITMGTDGTQHSMVWVDFNQNGVFDASEAFLGASVGASATATISIVVPSGIPAGNTKMRVRGASDGAYTAAGACSSTTYGETEDYLVNIVCPTPTALTATAITATGATLGWTSSSSSFDIEYGTTGFSQGSGTTTTSVTNSKAITGLSSTTGYDFFVRTNCGSGSYSTWVGPYPFTTGSPIDAGVSNLVVADMCQANGTSNISVLLSNLGIAGIIAGDVNLALSINGTQVATANNSTTLDIIGSGNPTTETVTFSNVALGAAASMTFSVTASTVGDLTAANNTVNATNIIGIVSAGTATTTAAGAICPSVTFDLGLTGVNASSSTTYQWQASTNGGGIWTNISGATTATVTGLTQSATTIYHCVLTCGGTNMTSSDITVTSSPFYNCYCTAGATSTSFEKISNVAIGTINNASTSTAGYEDFTAQSTNLMLGSSNSLTITISGGYSSDIVLVWIDLNQNGSFTDAGENIYTSAQGVGPHTGTITIPTTALTGVTRMRIRMSDASTGHNATPCGTSTYGQVEDYLVNIVCPTPTALTATSITGTGATLGWTSALSSFDVEYGLSGFTQGTGTATTSATTSKAITGLTPGTSYSFYVRTNCSTNSTWAGPYTFSTACAPTSSTSIPTTPNTTVYATSVCVDGAGWTYFYNGGNLLLGLEMGAWNPGTLTAGVPGAGQYSVKVSVGGSSVTNLTTAPYNNSPYNTVVNPWYVFNRTWDIDFNSLTQEPSNSGMPSVNIKSYFTDAEYQALNGYFTAPGTALTSPAQMTMYKLKRVSPLWAGQPGASATTYVSSMAAMNATHAGINATSIDFYNNQLANYPDWICATNTPATGIHTAQLSVTEFSGGGGGAGPSGNAPLPVNMAYFTGYNQLNSNVLNWATSSELGNKAFEVQRSLDGNTFETIGQVNSKAVNGISNELLTYEFADNNPAIISYYRLKQIDIDGNQSIFPNVVEISLIKDAKPIISLFPNPATNELNVSIVGNTAENYQVEVSDIYGKTVISAQQITHVGTTIAKIDIHHLAAGTYLLKVSNGTSYTQRFVKE